MQAILADLEGLIRFDPGGRGLASWSGEGAPLLAGGLADGVRLLEAMEGAVVLVSGFPILSAEPPVAETDGPLGALVLGRTLAALGKPVVFLTDELAAPLFRAGVPRMFPDGAAPGLVVVGGGDPCDPAATEEKLRASVGCTIGGLVAVERVGPNFDPRAARAAGAGGPSAAFEEAFRRAVPETLWGRPLNMRGNPVDHLAAPLHRLFELPPGRRPPTIGIGDGGNEIGMGRLPPETIAAAVTNGMGMRIACRVATDAAVLAGVSNWGGYALALGLAAALGRVGAADAASRPAAVAALLGTLVDEAGAVDGTTGRSSRTVDGLPWEVEAEMLHRLRRAVGLT